MERIHFVQLPASGDELTTFDLPKNLNHLSVEPEVVELRFKNGRKVFFMNTPGLELAKDDRVVVNSGDGYDLGTVFLSGKSAQKKFSDSGMNFSALERVVRKATVKDLQKWLDAKKTEYALLLKAREIAAGQEIDISIRDAEFLGDGRKVSLYFTAPEHVDTRDLHSKYASELGISVELCPSGYS